LKSSKIRFRKHIFDIHPYKHVVEVIETNDVGKYGAFHGLYDYSKAGAFHYSLPDEFKSIVVFSEDGTYGEIAHEVYHVMCCVYRTRGVKHRDEESTAYFLEDLVNDVVSALHSMKKKKFRYITKPMRKAK
jgi:hypothetical protein